jgi:hypothetical protein
MEASLTRYWPLVTNFTPFGAPGFTWNIVPRLGRPPTVTTMLPVLAPAGTGTMILLADHVVGVAAMPLKVTVLLPWVAPKLLPLIVTTVATGPFDGETLVRVGAAVTE